MVITNRAKERPARERGRFLKPLEIERFRCISEETPERLGEFSCRVPIYRPSSIPVHGTCFGDDVLLGLEERSAGMLVWGFLGGRRKPGESLEECGIRELKEEIGVTLAKEDLSLEAVFVPWERLKPRWHMTAFLSCEKPVNRELIAREAKIKALCWFPVRGLSVDKPLEDEGSHGAFMSSSHYEYVRNAYGGQLGRTRQWHRSRGMSAEACYR